MSVSYGRAVGNFVKQVRKTYKVTQDQLSQAMTDYGFNWSQGHVSALERGDLSMTVPVAIALASALTAVTGQPCRLSDITGDAEKIELNDRVQIDHIDLVKALNGQVVELDTEWTETSLTEMRNSISDAMTLSPGKTVGEHREFIDKAKKLPVNLAVKRASKKLNIPPTFLQAWCVWLYGHPFDTEVIERAGVDASPQKKGHATRDIIDEIRNELDGNRTVMLNRSSDD